MLQASYKNVSGKVYVQLEAISSFTASDLILRCSRSVPQRQDFEADATSSMAKENVSRKKKKKKKKMTWGKTHGEKKKWLKGGMLYNIVYTQRWAKVDVYSPRQTGYKSAKKAKQNSDTKKRVIRVDEEPPGGQTCVHVRLEQLQRTLEYHRQTCRRSCNTPSTFCKIQACALCKTSFCSARQEKAQVVSGNVLSLSQSCIMRHGIWTYTILKIWCVSSDRQTGNITFHCHYLSFIFF